MYVYSAPLILAKAQYIFVNNFIMCTKLKIKNKRWFMFFIEFDVDGKKHMHWLEFVAVKEKKLETEWEAGTSAASVNFTHLRICFFSINSIIIRTFHEIIFHGKYENPFNLPQWHETNSIQPE